MIVRVISWFLCCAVAGWIVSASAAREQQAKKAPPPSSNSPSGAELYHGNDLKGNGPFLRLIEDRLILTTLSRRQGGSFPDAYVAKVVRNGAAPPAHGQAEIPVWGTEFAGPTAWIQFK